MPFAPRHYISGTPHEIIFRARKGFPLPPKRVIKTLLKSALARTQRDLKVHVCHFLWMANHVHLLIIIKDAEAAKLFYTELMKKITDQTKAMIGARYLNLWQKRPTVARLDSFDDVKSKIAYIYANPTRADLTDTIEEYPGYSTYDDWQKSESKINFTTEELVPWIRTPSIGLLPRTMSDRQDVWNSERLIKSAKKKHTLILEPNLWMNCYDGITDAHVREVNEQILHDLKGRESEYRQLRDSKGKSVMGINKLMKVAIMQSYEPKEDPTDRRIFIICQDKDKRILLLQQFREFAALCKERYLEWKNGNYSNGWPAGGFRPPMPPTANAI